MMRKCKDCDNCIPDCNDDCKPNGKHRCMWLTEDHPHVDPESTMAETCDGFFVDPDKDV